MQFQWYPGHMTKAKRMMQENIKLIDLVIELVDARIPLSSRNPDIDELGKNKARLILLNKADLADDVCNKEWIAYFKKRGFHVLEINAKAVKDFFNIKQNRMLTARLEQLGIDTSCEKAPETGDALKGMTFVLTGTLPNLSRSQAKALIEGAGGKVSGSVSKRTSYVLA